MRASTSRRRIGSATEASSRFASTIPSIMSAATSLTSRPRIWMATTAPSPIRRIVRATPFTRGGLRNAGTARPASRLSAARNLAIAANLVAPTPSTPGGSHDGETIPIGRPASSTCATMNSRASASGRLPTCSPPLVPRSGSTISGRPASGTSTTVNRGASASGRLPTCSPPLVPRSGSIISGRRGERVGA